VTWFGRLLDDEAGATTAEYGLVAAILSVLMIGGLTAIIAECVTNLSSTSSGLTGLGSSPP
jgi:Flp pilus assembly pilin Flp